MDEEIVEKGFYGEPVDTKDLEIGQLVYIEGTDGAYYLGTLVEFSEDKKNVKVKLLSDDGQESDEMPLETSMLKEPMYYELTQADIDEINAEPEEEEEEEIKE